MGTSGLVALRAASRPGSLGPQQPLLQGEVPVPDLQVPLAVLFVLRAARDGTWSLSDANFTTR